MTALPDIPVGYCQCGCGEKAPIATVTRRTVGREQRKGEPLGFVQGHGGRKQHLAEVQDAHRAAWMRVGVEYGLCLCGCGERTPLARKTSSAFGLIKGRPHRYIRGHHNRLRMPRQRMSLEDRFWQKVRTAPADECWLWLGATQARGSYGVINSGGRGPTMRAHRVAWTLTRGAIPDGLEVCHSCDNPPCVNPAHLFLGTHAENMADAAVKGRIVAVRHNAKLSLADADAIRAAWATGTVTQRQLAARYGVHNSAVCRTIKGVQNASR